MIFSCAGNPPVPAKIEPTSSQNKDCRSCLAQLLFTASGEADLPTDDGPRPAAKLALRRRLWPAWARNVPEVPPGMGPNRAHEQTIRRHKYIYSIYIYVYIGGWGGKPGNRFVSCVRAREVWLPGEIRANFTGAGFSLSLFVLMLGFPFSPSESKWEQVKPSETK